MTDTTGLIVQGTDASEDLSPDVVTDDNGNRLIYNIIYAGDGEDHLDASELPVDVQSQYGVQLYGENGNDHIVDSVGSDTINGGSGDDDLSVHGSHDFIDGGDGVDTLLINQPGNLSSKNVTIAGIEVLKISGQVKVADFDFSQFQVIDTESYAWHFHRQAALRGIEFQGESVNFYGSSGSDTFDISTSHCVAVIDGRDGDDVITGGLKTNIFDGGAGNDILTGSGKEDHLKGGTGDDTIVGGAQNDSLLGGYGDDTLNGGDGKDYLLGHDGNDTLSGGNHTDTLAGEAGDDVVFGGNGNDWIQDTEGNDTVDGGGGNDSIILTGGKDEINAGDGNDWLSLTYGSFIVDGGAGNDFMSVDVRTDDQAVSINGGDGDDHVFYSSEHGPSPLTLHGGSGTDVFEVGVKQDLSLLEADGMEILRISGPQLTIGAATLGGFKGVDCHAIRNLYFSPLEITLASGGSFNWQVVRTPLKSAIMTGSDERERMNFSGSHTDWSVHGRGGDDMITSGIGRNVLEGNDGNDVLLGQGKFDVLVGNSGNDLLSAGPGLSNMEGGLGNDRFVFSDQTGDAVIYDFHHVHDDTGRDDMDKIDLSHVSTIRNFGDLVAHHLKSMDSGLIITYGGSEIALPGVGKGDLHADDFHF